MATFTFEGIDAQGREVRSEVDAVSEQEALTRIRGMGVRPVKVAAKSGRAAAGTPMAGKKSAGILAGLGGVSGKSITQFTRQFATLIDAGLPIVRSLDILANQQKVGPFKSAIEAISDDVKGGSTLSESMAKHPRIFDKLYVNMVKAGEAGGVLDTILTRLAEFREKVEALRRKIIGAMVYPATVITIAVAILLFIMMYIIPKFKTMFDEMGLGSLPPMTELLIAIASTLASLWGVLIIIAIPVIVIVSYMAIVANPQGRFLVDTAKLNLPIFGQLIRKSVISRFCRTLGTLLESGVTILDALNILRGAVGNAVIANAVGEVHASIREGDNIATPLRRCKAFDDIVINMIDVGEETGELPKMLSKVADNYDSEVDATVAGLTSLLEPIMIIGLGGCVGFIVISLFLPMIDMMDKLGKEGGGK